LIHLNRRGVVLRPEPPEVRTAAKFNAGMVRDGDVVHMAYRYAERRDTFDPHVESNYAVDEIRYARLALDGTLVEDTGRPLIAPSSPMDDSGCQDARIVHFEGVYYLTYCGWDKNRVRAGQDKARVGLARTCDFRSCEKLGIIDHYAWDKDAFIFPERIGGRIGYVHRIDPNIQIDYFDSFEQLLDPGNWSDYQDRVEEATVLRAAYSWECGKVGGSVPPIRTRDGWLLIYHAVELFPDRPFIYRAGAALLDIEDPSRVVARLPYPILEPEEEYELRGDVDNVVFPVGAYEHEGDLYISYGAADRCVAMATVPLDDLLKELSRHPAGSREG
jgi:beta-1,2-mannobiose phosphorylase / 1,2-beta-oligomannan phosphorylase